MPICKNCSQNFTLTIRTKKFCESENPSRHSVRTAVCEDNQRDDKVLSRECGLTGQKFISRIAEYPPVYKADEWWKDDWIRDYGQNSTDVFEHGMN